MSANDHIVNDTFIPVDKNMKVRDAATRLLLTAGLIGTLFTVQSIQYLDLLVLAITYLFTTAITRWDPIYALLGLRLADDQQSNPGDMSEGSVRSGIGQHGGNTAANDTHNAEKHLRKAG